jgi:transposase
VHSVPQMSVIMGPERRRRWRPDEKLAVVVEVFAPGAIVSDVSRRLNVATSLIYKWRRDAMGSAGFVPVVIGDENEARRAPLSGSPVIVIELGGGVRVSVGASASASLVTAALEALK